MGANYLFWALLLLTLPLNWLAAAVAAAAWHEGCHFLAVWLLGGRAGSFRVGLSGAVLDVAGLTPWAECLAALAGPLGGLMLTGLWRQFPRLALCAAAQSAFNLLPVYPLDGGRALRCCLDMLFPRHSRGIGIAAEGICLGFLLAFCAVNRLFPLLIWGILTLLTRKRPCKASFLRVQ